MNISRKRLYVNEGPKEAPHSSPKQYFLSDRPLGFDGLPEDQVLSLVSGFKKKHRQGSEYHQTLDVYGKNGHLCFLFPVVIHYFCLIRAL